MCVGSLYFNLHSLSHLEPGESQTRLRPSAKAE